MNRKSNFLYFIATRAFVICAIFSFFAHVTIIAYNYNYSVKLQNVNREIQTIEASIDALEMKKQELVSFERLTEVTARYGYTYRSDAVASYSSTYGVVSE